MGFCILLLLLYYKYKKKARKRRDEKRFVSTIIIKKCDNFNIKMKQKCEQKVQKTDTKGQGKEATTKQHTKAK